MFYFLLQKSRLYICSICEVEQKYRYKSIHKFLMPGKKTGLCHCIGEWILYFFSSFLPLHSLCVRREMNSQDILFLFIIICKNLFFLLLSFFSFLFSYFLCKPSQKEFLCANLFVIIKLIYVTHIKAGHKRTLKLI